ALHDSTANATDRASGRIGIGDAPAFRVARIIPAQPRAAPCVAAHRGPRLRVSLRPSPPPPCASHPASWSLRLTPPNPTAPPRTADEAWAAFDACLGRFDLDEARRRLLPLMEDPGADRNRACFALASLRMQEGFTQEALALLHGLIESNPS